jgi:hypothetical protein
LPKEGISQALPCVGDFRRQQTEEQSCEREDEASSSWPRGNNRGSFHDRRFFLMTTASAASSR